MTNTPLSEREKELLAAAIEICTNRTDTWNGWEVFDRLKKAAQAYDPKPEPVPVMPPWNEFALAQGGEYSLNWGDPDKRFVDTGRGTVSKEFYEYLRTLTSKAPTE